MCVTYSLTLNKVVMFDLLCLFKMQIPAWHRNKQIPIAGKKGTKGCNKAHKIQAAFTLYLKLGHRLCVSCFLHYTCSPSPWPFFSIFNLHRGHVAFMCSHLSMHAE